MKSRCLWWVVFAIAIIVILGEYTSTLFYFAYRCGFINDPIVNGITIKMKEGWFPEPTTAGQHFADKADKQFPGIVVLLKIKGIRPGVENRMTIFPASLPKNSNINLGAHSEVRRYSWGEGRIFNSNFIAHILNERNKGDWIVEIEKYNLVIHTPDLSSLDEIKSLDDQK